MLCKCEVVGCNVLRSAAASTFVPRNKQNMRPPIPGGAQATKALSKQTRSTEHFDWVKHIDRSIITEGFEHAVASGNWTIKRFRMDRKGTTQVSRVVGALLSLKQSHNGFA